MGARFAIDASRLELSDAWIEGDEAARRRSAPGHSEEHGARTTGIPEGVPHEVRNAGEETLRFMAVHASYDVATTCEDEVQPDGGRERSPLG